jgi:hypothetical protein
MNPITMTTMMMNMNIMVINITGFRPGRKKSYMAIDQHGTMRRGTGGRETANLKREFESF